MIVISFGEKVYSLIDEKELVALVVQAPALAGQFIPGDHDRLSDPTLKPGALPLWRKRAFCDKTIKNKHYIFDKIDYKLIVVVNFPEKLHGNNLSWFDELTEYRDIQKFLLSNFFLFKKEGGKKYYFQNILSDNMYNSRQMGRRSKTKGPGTTLWNRRK